LHLERDYRGDTFPNLFHADHTFSGKRGRGRPYKIRAGEVTGRAYNYRIIFSQIWKSVGEQLVGSKTEAEILQALEKTAYRREFESEAALILSVLRDRDFPKRDRDARINFLADSIAARGVVTPRTSRDIVRESAQWNGRSHLFRLSATNITLSARVAIKAPHTTMLAANAALKLISCRKS